LTNEKRRREREIYGKNIAISAPDHPNKKSKKK
jgi:hypothetical protein